jgi:hypothetical protein
MMSGDEWHTERERQQRLLDAQTGYRPPEDTKRGRCDHCGEWDDVRAVWNRGVAVEFKWLCPRDEALTKW